MKILLDGYFDRNLGDDLMMTLAAEGLKEHEVFKDKTRRADVYLKVTGSGFLIHNNLGIAYRLRDMHREKNYAPLKAVIGCNISKPINSLAEGVIKRQLKSYDFITVRDSFSEDYINKRVKGAKCEKYPDIVFSLPDEMIPDTACEDLFGIAVHNSMDFEKTARTADKYIEETGKNTLLLCFDTGSENDALAAERIRQRAKYKDKIETVIYNGDISAMLQAMKRCSVILGARLHSIVLAARMEIPFVPMAYSDKTANMLGEIGYDGKIYSAMDFDAAEAAKAVLNPAPYILDKRIIMDAQNHILKFKEFLKQQA